MITKEKLIDQLEECLNTEESAIPLYAKHINSTLFLSGFTDDSCSRIKEILSELASDSDHHTSMFEQLIEHVKSGGKDVY
jgi:rubrerythrin